MNIEDFEQNPLPEEDLAKFEFLQVQMGQISGLPAKREVLAANQEPAYGILSDSLYEEFGSFSFTKNHHPVQDIYVREVIKEGDVYTNKIVSTAMTGHGNAYVDQCNM